MSTSIDNIQAAIQRAAAVRPRVGDFPYLAETLRQAGVTRNSWSLPSCQGLFITDTGSVALQAEPLISGMVDIPPFNRNSLIHALRTDQAGNSTFPEFLSSVRQSGIVSYDVDSAVRTVTYRGINDEVYVESYAAAEL